MDVLGLLTSLQVAYKPLLGKPWGLPSGSGLDGQSGPTETHEVVGREVPAVSGTVLVS